MMKSDFVIKIFTEGGEKIGFGHISRCTALYVEAERRGFSVELFIQDIDYNFTGNCILENRSYSIVNWQSLEYLKNNLDKNDYCIIDSYLASIEVYVEIAQRSAKALYIDDFGRLDYPKGIIVNPSLSTEGIHYHQKPDQEYLLGHEYIILRSPFIGKKKTNYSKNVNRILITLGGTDILNLTGEILNLLIPIFPEITFDIVLGKELDDQNKWWQFGNIHFYSNLNEKEMCELMLKSDFVITAAGQTIYELMTLGIPFLAIQTAKNQCNNINVLRNRGNMITLDRNDLPKIETILREVIISYGAIHDRQSDIAFVDGLGSKRIMNTLIKRPDKFELRKANMTDCNLLFKWANDLEVRNNAFNTEKILFEDHVAWIDKKIMNEKTDMYIAYAGETPIGQIRVDTNSSNEGEIDYSIDSRFRGQGYGERLLNELIRIIDKKKQNQIIRLVGKVKYNNIASQKAFQKVGFKETQEDDYFVYTYEFEC